MELLFDIQHSFLQELALIVFIILNIILSLFFSKKFYKLSKWFAIGAVIITILASIFIQLSPNYYAFGNAFLSNVYTVFFKNLILISVFFVILLSRNMIKQKRNKAFEYFTLLLSATLGALCLVSSNDFVSASYRWKLLESLHIYLLLLIKITNQKRLGLNI